MTLQERKLVIEYINAEILDSGCSPMTESNPTMNHELIIKAHYNTLNFKFYALRAAWRAVWKPIIDPIVNMFRKIN